MERIEISDDLRRKARSSNAHQIFLADPRDIISVADKINEIVEFLNAKFPGEISHELLMAVLHGD